MCCVAEVCDEGRRVGEGLRWPWLRADLGIWRASGSG
jgi:hypothetical protein